MLAQTLAAVRKRITKRPKLNENDTKATLIEPVLAALGWDVHDVGEDEDGHEPPAARSLGHRLDAHAWKRGA